MNTLINSDCATHDKTKQIMKLDKYKRITEASASGQEENSQQNKQEHN